MEIQYFGANCVRIGTKKSSIIVDDNLMELGLKSVTKDGETALFTGPHGDSSPKTEPKITIDQPGEYEVTDTSIQGIAARSHMDEEGKKNATMFKIVDDDIKVVVTGHIYPDLTDKQLEEIGMVDVLIIPIGGNGYTLDGLGALKVIRKIEPKVVIPTHYDDTGVNFPVPQQALSDALQNLGMEPAERVAKYKVKAGELADSTQLIVLEK